MWFAKPPNQDRNATVCPECTWSTPLHHPCCSHHSESTALVDLFEDYRHLVGPPAMSQYKSCSDSGFDEMLTDDDQILLRGMRISWQA
ncbi:MAG: hypothetical protein JOZ33_12510 [Acidobacteriaceae bacterium]|nr:hypothetical protein [Acidobacteriaceae bacterium]